MLITQQTRSRLENEAAGAYRPSTVATYPVDAESPPFRFDVAVLGLGYVGLPTALALHAAGRKVIGIDINPARLAAIRVSEVDLLPSDHSRLLGALDDREDFELSSAVERLGEAAVVLVCVPTPVDHHLLPDLSPLAGACRTVVAHAVAGQTLVLTSTTYVGCTRDLLVAPLAEQRGLRAGREVFVTFAPERIDPGNERHVQKQVPRVVGGVSAECVARTAALLEGCASFIHPVSSVEAAEMTKLYENTFRAVNISLANEFADIARVLELDIAEVIAAAATKPYGFMAFHPGPGVGGHCIPCDPHYLLWQLRAERVSAPMIETAMASVAARPSRVVQRAGEVLAQHGRALAGARVLVFGAAYKPGVADVRESPALEILDRLRRAGAQVAYTDPLIDEVALGAEELTSVTDPADSRWDLVIVHTLHPGVDTGWLRGQPAVLDTTYKLTDLETRHIL